MTILFKKEFLEYPNYSTIGKFFYKTLILLLKENKKKIDEYS